MSRDGDQAASEMAQTEEGELRTGTGRLESRLLITALVGGLLLRLGTWPQVFVGGRIWLDGPDSYYHLRRAWLTLQNWPHAPQTDMLIGVPNGGPISWPPVFDLLLATAALPWRSAPAATLEQAGAFLPPLLGMLEILLLYLLVRRLFGPIAAGWAALVAAILPGVSRYSLLGALDHDPLVESMALVALFGLAAAMSRAKVRWADVMWVGLGITALILTWAGSVLHLGLLCCVVGIAELSALWSRRESTLAATLGAGSLVAVLATLPFIAQSVWTERMTATFIGVSWLHTTVLLGVAAGGLAIATWTRPTRLRLALLCAVAVSLLVLVGSAWPAFRAGVTFFSRGEPFLQGVMESRPLLSLFGTFDLRAPIIRLSLLPFLIPFLLPWTLRRSGMDRRWMFLWVWLLYLLGIALVQARYAHAAALPIAALAGVLISGGGGAVAGRLKRTVAALVLAFVLLPSIPAYIAIPGLEPFRFFGRVPKILSTGFFEACGFLRDEVGPSESWFDHTKPSSSSVLAPWSAGHWLIWIGRQGTVTTPLGPQGQDAFADGIRFYLESDADTVRHLLDLHRVRYFVATAQIPALETYASLAGVTPDVVFDVDDGPGPWPLDAEKYLSTVAARLTWIGPEKIDLFGRKLPALDDFSEVFRSSQTRPNPFAGAVPGDAPAEVPLVRVFAVRQRRNAPRGP
jgi:dolichyl-diphosphooligosaccharide--protein glycosyltransferase